MQGQGRGTLTRVRTPLRLRKPLTRETGLQDFKQAIWDNYRLHPRALAWRETRDPYAILVSEIMLQQTQVSRVIPKYSAWLELFPTIGALASSSLASALSAWSGLGYNRRGKWLRECAILIQERHGGLVPKEPEVLAALPGIGPYTSKAISTFAFGLPHVFIETNIRRVYIHFFFQARAAEEKIKDAEILPLIEASLEREDPRSWYYALMDYGAELPKYIENPNRRSSAHVIQSPLKGSLREARGAILRLLASGSRPWPALLADSGIEEARMEKAAKALISEGMLCAHDGIYMIRD